MILSVKNVPHYLVNCGLLNAHDLVDGHLMVVELLRRNRNFKVLRKRLPGYFVKQIQISEPQGAAALQREATVCWLPENDPGFTAIKTLVPKYRLYDPVRSALVTELIPAAESLSEYHQRLKTFPVQIGHLLGTTLATYHRLPLVDLQNNKHLNAFPKAVPWILSIHQQDASRLNQLSMGNTQLIALIQQHSDFHPLLDSLHAQWQRSSLIHGDMKWDNCLVRYPPGRGDEGTLYLVDWELADVGDACWDVGGVFQAYLSFWILSIQMTTGMAPAQMAELAQYPIEAMQPAIHAFWKTYQNAMQRE